MSPLRKALLLLFSLLILTLALYPKTFLLKILEWKIQCVCSKTFGTTLHFEELSWEKGEILIKKGSLEKEKMVAFSFQQASFKPLLQGSILKGECLVSGLLIHHQKEKNGSPFIPSFLKPCKKSPFLSFEINVKIPQAELLLEKEAEICHYFCDLDLLFHENHLKGQLILDEKKNTPQLILKISQEPHNLLYVTSSFDSHDFPSLYSLINYFAPPQAPSSLTSWVFNKGKIDGFLQLAVRQGALSEVKSCLKISSLEGDNSEYHLLGSLDSFTSSLYIDLHTLSSFEGEFDLTGGKLALKDFWQNINSISDLHSKICVKKGRVESSTIKGRLMGMEGELFLNWKAEDTLMEMDFQGSSQDLSAFIPEMIRTEFINSFPDDHFLLKALWKRRGRGHELKGNLSITDLSERHSLDFGCLFNEEITNECEGNFPFSLSQSRDHFLKTMKEQFSLSQNYLGWFRGENLPIEKFISPFLCRGTALKGRGRADFEGTVDSQHLILSYSGRDIHLTGPIFSLEVPLLKEGGIHCIDFKRGDHVGLLPIRHGIFWQKSGDITFSNVDALLSFDNRKIGVQKIKAEWKELDFQGDVTINFHAKDNIDLVIAADTLQGPIQDLQCFVSHFFPSFFWNIPFEGVVEGTCDTLFLRYHFSPIPELLEGHIRGKLVANYENPLFTISDWQTEVMYDFETKRVSLEGGRGTLKIPFKELTYEFSTPVLVFSDLPQMQIDFSCLLEKEGSPFGNIVGKTTALEGKRRHIGFSGLIGEEIFLLEGIESDNHYTFSHGRLGDWEAEGNFILNGEKWEVEKFHIQKQHHVHAELDMCCHYQASLVEGNVKLLDEEGGLLFNFPLGKLQYGKNRILFEKFDFSLPQWGRSHLVHLAQTFFPLKIVQEKIGWLEAVKHEEPLEGRISIEIESGEVKVSLNLKDGTYYLYDKPFELRNFSLLYAQEQINSWMYMCIQGGDYWCHFFSDSLSLNQGSITLSEHILSSNHPQGVDSLFATWGRDRQNNWSLETLEGTLCGIEASLVADRQEDSLLFMRGRVVIDSGKGGSFLSEKIKEYIKKLKITGIYEVGGEWAFDQKSGEVKSFIGTAAAHHFGLYGIEVSDASCLLNYQLGQFIITDFVARDWAGRIFLNRASITQKGEGKWVSIDQVKLEELRFSRLKSPWTGKNGNFPSLYVRLLQLDDVHGNLKNLKTFEGRGSLDFSNIPKRTFISQLLFLPTEITARIGLDLTALIPARGKIVYQIEKGRVLFTHFNEMYSSGKKSRFYLAEGLPAYIDLEGNVNLNIKMKQYNLLMKLAEFFTISVRGSMWHPTYTFSNQIEENEYIQ